MILRKYSLKIVAMVLMVSILHTIISPSISYALTEGPSAPEASSFEPIDTTDMVNMNTGDFTYNLPLLEVPGPEGSFPLGLSYHGGIQNKQESSWVGLGWSLNPGAINRVVSGVADDHYHAEREVHDTWAGGSTTVTSVGIGMPVYGFASANFGVTFVNDTYKGFDMDISLAAAVGPKFGKHGYAQASYDLFQHKATAGVGLKVGKFKAGLDTDFSKVNAKVAFDTKYWPVVGAKISSKGLKTSFSYLGATYKQSNKNLGRLSTSTTGFSLPFLFLSISQQHTRYWMDEQSSVEAFGALRPASAAWGAPADWVADLRTYDSYVLPERMSIYQQQAAKRDYIPEAQPFGSLPAYDNFNVLGQGIGGTMRAYIFDNPSLFRQNSRTYYSATDSFEPQVTYKIKRYSNKKVNFRFINDPVQNFDPNGYADINSWWRFHNITDPEVMNPDLDNYNGSGFNPSDQHLAGSRHIEWFKINEIESGHARSQGFVDNETVHRPSSLTYFVGNETYPIKHETYNVEEQIGGFTITNETGMNYHYGQPVYAYKEYSEMKLTDHINGNRTHDETSEQPYAYTWLVTTITGPDYVDRNDNGVADEGDWGYWVNFNYGKWTDQYHWRTPTEGFEKEVDNNWVRFSRGVKELYYMNSVQTRTHTALFIKDIKHDGKAVVDEEGGFDPVNNVVQTGQNINTIYPYSSMMGYVPGTEVLHVTSNVAKVFKRYAAGTMKLDQVMLLDNQKLEDVLASNGISSMEDLKAEDGRLNLNNSYVETWYEYHDLGGDGVGYTSTGNTQVLQDHQMPLHHADNMLDVYDVEAIYSDLEGASIKLLDFDTDYSLCPETPNSFRDSKTYEGAPYWNQVYEQGMGKLTLKSLSTLGKGGVQTLPPMNFHYEIDNPTEVSVSLTKINADYGPDPKLQRAAQVHITGANAGSVSEGSIYKFELNGKTFYSSVVNIQSGGLVDLCILGENIPVESDKGDVVSATETKNPPYSEDFIDNWGYLKVDWFDYDHPSFNGVTSNLSAKAVDAWSMRKLETPIGAELKINYDSDEYAAVALNQENLFTIGGYNVINNGNDAEILLLGRPNLEEIFSPGDEISYLGFVNTGDFSYQVLDIQNAEVLSVSGDRIVVDKTHYEWDAHQAWNDISWRTDNFTSNNPIFMAGNIYGGSRHNRKGGGLRVVSLDVVNPVSGDVESVKYSYEEADGAFSSGHTTYEPIGAAVTTVFNESYVPYVNNSNPNMPLFDQGYARFEYLVNGYFSDIITFAQEVPAPNVNYNRVTAQRNVNGKDVLTHEEFNFQPFTTDMVDLNVLAYAGSNTHHPSYWRAVELKTSTMAMTQPTVHRVLEKNGAPVTETIYEYASSVGNIGVVKQKFNENRLIYPEEQLNPNVSPYYRGLGHSSWGGAFERRIHTVKTEVPSILTKVTQRNHITGVEMFTENIAFDENTGQVLESATKDGYGNTYKMVNVPAYRQTLADGVTPVYPELGLKVFDTKNRHMLTQEAASYTYLVDEADYDNVLGLKTASIQTWNDDWAYQLPVSNTDLADVSIVDEGYTPQDEQVWRKHRTYVWKDSYPNAQGFTSPSQIVGFNWDNISSQNDHWVKTGETQRYNEFSHPLEVTDDKGLSSSVIMGKKQSLVWMSSAGAKFTEMAYVSGEYDRNDHVFYDTHFEDGTEGKFLQQTHVHTGKYGMEVTSSNRLVHTFSTSPLTFSADQAMVASIWVHKDDVTNCRVKAAYADGVSEAYTTEETGANPTQKCGDWYLINLTIPALDEISGLPGYNGSVTPSELVVTVDNYQNSQPVHVDDFRVCPAGANTSSFVYDEDNQLQYLLNADHFYTRFEYDKGGRLIGTYIETEDGEKQVSSHEYNFAKLN